MKKVIVVLSDKVEVFSTFLGCCKELELPYHSLKMKEFPIEFGKYTIHKVELKQIK